jgi:hypothetical protein
MLPTVQLSKKNPRFQAGLPVNQKAVFSVNLFKIRRISAVAIPGLMGSAQMQT